MTIIQLEDKGFLNVKEDLSVPLNFNVQDILDFGSTNSSYSKDIILVGDNNNNQLLGHLFDVNITNSTFNVNKKVKCYVLQDGVSVFNDCFFQLISINNDYGVITYTGRIMSELLNFFTVIKNKELTDLQIHTPQDEHDLSLANVVTTFDNDVNDGYKYQIFMNDFTDKFDIQDLKPSIYVKKYWDTIHQQAGFAYDFQELSDLQLDKLLIPGVGIYQAKDQEKIDASFITEEYNTSFDAQNQGVPHQPGKNIGAGLYGNANTFGKKLTLPIPNSYIQNFNNNFNNVNKKYTPSFIGKHKLRFKFDFKLEYTFSHNVKLYTFGNALSLTNAVFFDARKSTQSNPNPRVHTNVIKTYHVDQKFFPAGTHTILNNTYELEVETNLNPIQFFDQISIIFEQGLGDAAGEGITIASGDRAFWGQSASQPISYYPTITLTNLQVIIEPQLDYNYGLPINLNNFIPKGIKQRDFIKSFIDMYRLVVEVDKDNPNKLIYTTRDKYYSTGKQKDWTQKLALDKNIKIEWIQEKQKKLLDFTYTEDEDTYNKIYQNNVKYMYGNYLYKFDNEYIIDKNEQKIIFSPTPGVEIIGNVYVPTLLGNGADYNIRLLYDYVRDGDTTYSVKSPLGAYVTYTKYASGSHFNNPEFPTYDINFGPAAYYFYDINPTQNNLYNLYHRRTVKQLTEGKIMTAFFNLNPSDIRDLKLNDKIFITDTWWSINKVIDYNANGNQLTKVELITLEDETKINIKGNFDGTPVGPIKNPGGVLTGNPLGEIVKDKYKSTTVSNAPIVGDINGKDNEYYGSDPFNGMVVGNNNQIGQPNVMVFGSNKNVTENNSIYSDNIFTDSLNGEPINQIIGTEPIDITRIDLITLRDNSELIPNRWYRLIDFSNEYEKYIYMKSINNNELSNLSLGTIKVLKDEIYTNTLPSGLNGEGNYGVVYPGLQFGDAGFAVYHLIWGGKLWKFSGTNVNITISQYPSDNYDLSTNFDSIPSNLSEVPLNHYNTYYTHWLNVEYNLDDGLVYSLSDNRNKITLLTPVADIPRCDWGRKTIINNNIFGVILNNSTPVIRNNSNYGTIYNNSNNGTIHSNSNNGPIYNNSNNGTIHSNSNNGTIHSNSNDGNIHNNSNYGPIYNNSNYGNIRNNSNYGHIYNNSNYGPIYNNSNNGTIHSNSNNGIINYNSNGGNIYNNSNSGIINSNSNGGDIHSNSSTLTSYNHITNNSNLGLITRNNFTNSNIHIQYNGTSTKDIGNVSSTTNRSTTVTDSPISK